MLLVGWPSARYKWPGISSTGPNSPTAGVFLPLFCLEGKLSAETVRHDPSKCKVIIWPPASQKSTPDLKSNSTGSGSQ